MLLDNIRHWTFESVLTFFVDQRPVSPWAAFNLRTVKTIAGLTHVLAHFKNMGDQKHKGNFYRFFFGSTILRRHTLIGSSRTQSQTPAVSCNQTWLLLKKQIWRAINIVSWLPKPALCSAPKNKKMSNAGWVDGFGASCESVLYSCCETGEALTRSGALKCVSTPPNWGGCGRIIVCDQAAGQATPPNRCGGRAACVWPA